MRDPFGKGKDAARREEIERQAQEEVERLTRRRPAPGGGGMGGGGMGGGGMAGGMAGPGAGIGPPSPLEMMAQQMRQRRKPRQGAEQRGSGFDTGGGRVIPAGLISGSVGSGFGPAGLNPGPAFARSMNPQPPPTAFEAPEFEESMGRSVRDAPPIPHGDQDELEDEEVSITEMALMDQAARSGSNPEDLVVRYDPRSAEEARDRAMRQFNERRRAPSRPVTAGMAKDPFTSAAMRNQSAAAIAQARVSGPPPTPTLGGALGRIAAQRRQAQPPPSSGRAAGGRAAGGRAAGGRTIPGSTAGGGKAATDAASGRSVGRDTSPRAGAAKPTSAPTRSPARGPATEPRPEPASPSAGLPVDEGGGALARLLARRERSPIAGRPVAAPAAPTGRLHARQRAESRALAPDDTAGPDDTPDPRRSTASRTPATRAMTTKAQTAPAAAPPRATSPRTAQPAAKRSPKGAKASPAPKVAESAAAAATATAATAAAATARAVKATTTTSKPATKRAATTKPVAAKAGSDKPVAAKSVTAKPVAAKSARAKSVTAKPVAAKSVTAKAPAGKAAVTKAAGTGKR